MNKTIADILAGVPDQIDLSRLPDQPNPFDSFNPDAYLAQPPPWLRQLVGTRRYASTGPNPTKADAFLDEVVLSGQQTRSFDDLIPLAPRDDSPVEFQYCLRAWLSWQPRRMGTPHGSSCEAVNDCSTSIAFSGNTSSTPGDSKTFQARRCDVISITVKERCYGPKWIT
jgi:hypothetical protein